MPSLWNNVDKLMQKTLEKREEQEKKHVSYSVAAEVVISNSVEPTFTGMN